MERPRVRPTSSSPTGSRGIKSCRSLNTSAVTAAAPSNASFRAMIPKRIVSTATAKTSKNNFPYSLSPELRAHPPIFPPKQAAADAAPPSQECAAAETIRDGGELPKCLLLNGVSVNLPPSRIIGRLVSLGCKDRRSAMGMDPAVGRI